MVVLGIFFFVFRVVNFEFGIVWFMCLGVKRVFKVFY